MLEAALGGVTETLPEGNSMHPESDSGLRSLPESDVAAGTHSLSSLSQTLGDLQVQGTEEELDDGGKAH